MTSIYSEKHDEAALLGWNKHFAEAYAAYLQQLDRNSDKKTRKHEQQGADRVLHHTETDLLSAEARSYSEKYWNKRVPAPSMFIAYLGIGRELKGFAHRNLYCTGQYTHPGVGVPMTRIASEIVADELKNTYTEDGTVKS